MNEAVLQVPEWVSFTWLRHGFSTRRGGVSTAYKADRETSDADLNTGWTASDDPANVVENRRRLIEAVNPDAVPGDLLTLRQVHSASSLIVPANTDKFFSAEGRAVLDGDGLMTDRVGPLLGIQTADCVPVLVVDPKRRAVAAFHAGWRGTAAAIVENGIAQMVAEFGSRPEDLMAAIGPSIGACCYSVGEEVQAAFRQAFRYSSDLFEMRAQEGGERLYVDLWMANRRQLLSAGLSPQRITVIGECSGCAGLPGRRKYFSHRCEGGFTGRMMSVIGIVPESIQQIT